MRIVYLKDGRKCKWIAKTENGYIVDPFHVCFGYNAEGEAEEDGSEEPSGQLLQVDKVYGAPPIEVIDAEYNALLELVKEERGKLATVQHAVNRNNQELQQIKNAKTDLSRYIINREELRLAKRLIVFRKDAIAPSIMDGLGSKRFTVSYEISQYKGEEKCWVYKLWSEDRNSGSWLSGDYFDSEYGIMVDLTDEQINEKTIERQNKRGLKGFFSHVISSTPDELLTPEFLAEKQRLKERDSKIALEEAEKELKQAQEKYNRLAGLATA